MTRFYIKLILPIAAACLIFMLIARAIGTTQPPKLALSGFVEGCENKPQPCWYGIVPGVTTVGGTLQKLEIVGYRQSENYLLLPPNANTYCDVTLHSDQEENLLVSEDAVIGDLQLSCGEILLGDMMSISGFIERIQTWSRPTMSLLLKNKSSIQIAEKESRRQPVWASPFSRVDAIHLTGDSRRQGYAWHGFAFSWHYCQVEPGAAAC